MNTIIKTVNSIIILNNTIPNKSCCLPCLILDDHLVFDQSKIIVNTKPNSVYSNFNSSDTNWALTQINNIQGIALKNTQSSLPLLIAEYDAISQ